MELRKEVRERMDGLINQNLEADFLKLARAIVSDFVIEGFDETDAILYLRNLLTRKNLEEK